MNVWAPITGIIVGSVLFGASFIVVSGWLLLLGALLLAVSFVGGLLGYGRASDQ